MEHDYGLSIEVCELRHYSEKGPSNELKRHDVVLADAVETILSCKPQPSWSGEADRSRR
jgi:hypothetical protein